MFTEAQISEMADRGDTTVYGYKQTKFEPYTTGEVTKCIDKLISLMNLFPENVHEHAKKDSGLMDFAQKYQVFYNNLTDKEFVSNEKNIVTIRKLVSLKARLDSGEVSEEAARTQCSAIALETTVKQKTNK